VANVVDAIYYVLVGVKDVKILQNLSNSEANVIHTGNRVKYLFVLSVSSFYVSKMRTNVGYIWHASLGHLSMKKLKAIVS